MSLQNEKVFLSLLGQFVTCTHNFLMFSSYFFLEVNLQTKLNKYVKWIFNTSE